MTDQHQLYIITDVEEAVEASPEVRGRRDGRRDTGYNPSPPGFVEQMATTLKPKRVPVDVQLLKNQMEGLLTVMDDLFEQAQASRSLSLEEVELSVDINAEGQVSIVGNGGKLGNKGAIKLKFNRKG